MSSVVFVKQDIYSLIEHEIALLERFNMVEEAPFSLVYFNLEGRQEIDIARVFQRILRKTDALFQDDDNFVLLLPGTDWNGATELLAGIQDFLNQDPIDTIVTFPDDGQDGKTLMLKLREKVEDFSGIKVKMLKLKS